MKYLWFSRKPMRAIVFPVQDCRDVGPKAKPRRKPWRNIQMPSTSIWQRWPSRSRVKIYEKLKLRFSQKMVRVRKD